MFRRLISALYVHGFMRSRVRFRSTFGWGLWLCHATLRPAALVPCAEPIPPAYPSLICICLIGSSGNVSWKLPRFGKCSPLVGRLQAKASNVRSSLLERSIYPLIGGHSVSADPICPTDPSVALVFSIRISGDIVGPLTGFAIGPPLTCRSQSQPADKGASFTKR